MDDTVDLREDGLGAPTLGAALEALLILADEPQPAVVLAERTRTPEDAVGAELRRLAGEYEAQGRGFELRETDGGWRLYSAASCRDLVNRLVTDERLTRLSQAALETLAIVAYRQPVTRAHVGAVRGVNADGVIRTLVARGLIAELGEAGEAGSAQFVTTAYFLDRMGIASLDDLPPIADHVPDFSDLDDLLD